MTKQWTRIGTCLARAVPALAIVVLLLGLSSSSAIAQAPAPGKAQLRQWEVALQPLRTMPVQDFGFVDTVFTFSENHLLAIADVRSYEGMSALQTIIRFLADPQQARSVQLIKVERPELVKLFGATRISVARYRDPAMQQQLMQLVSQDQEKWLRPLNELDTKARFLEELPDDFTIIPRHGEWLSPNKIKAELQQTTSAVHPLDENIIKSWDALVRALKVNDPRAGEEAAAKLTASVLASVQQQGIKLPKLKIDVLYHQHQPFAKSAFFYLVAALIYGASLLFGRRKLAWGGYVFLILGFLEQLVGIIFRWLLAGRAPLSNMYESFTFLIAGMVLIALVFEVVNKTRLVGLGAAVLGFIFVVLAHKAPIFDSQIRPLVPALQSSWLTYHVVTIMLSYSAFALSFFVTLTYLFKDMLGGDNAKSSLVRQLPSLQTLDIMNYKIIAVGFPLLTLGIILGAVWAATAWGRPWGFDPKETWSAITWLIYAIYLHARFLAGWKGRRAAVLSLLGFAAVLFTYLGVNYLLPGLHSYV